MGKLLERWREKRAERKRARRERAYQEKRQGVPGRGSGAPRGDVTIGQGGGGG